MKIKKLTVRSAITTILVIAVCIGMLGQSASALSSSSNVAIIGGPSVYHGGTLPTSGGGFNAFTFYTMDAADVSAANLAPYDTAVLNIGSSTIRCNSNALNVSQKSDLIDFVADGKKLIIFDSECPTGDYSWLPYPFVTANPGALGAQGTLTIVENNTLSDADPLSPYFINAAYLGSSTDAVGDMNVMTSYDPNWCIDMSGTNAIPAQGPVQTYAKYPAGTDTGLIIYCGLDLDAIAYTPQLQEVWLQQLQQPFNPSNLPCGVTVVGISLGPCCGVNIIGTQHTVTATITDVLGAPISGVDVTFNVTSGPNAGEGGMDTTDSNGEATFTYTGDGGLGTDEIVASFYDTQRQVTVESQTVHKEWVERTNGEIPEFPTIAVPVLAIIGLALFFRRK